MAQPSQRPSLDLADAFACQAISSVLYNAHLKLTPAAGETMVITPLNSRPDQVSLSPLSRQLDNSNWNTGRNFTITAVNDTVPEVDESGTITHNATSNVSGSPLNGIVACATMFVNIYDNDSATPTYTRTPTRTPTPTATPSATGLVCLPPNNTFEGDGEPSQDVRCPQLTPTSNPTSCVIAANTTLGDFGIMLEGTWNSSQSEEILIAARETGRALCLHGAGTDVVSAFRIVLQGMNATGWRKIKFSRTNFALPVCSTTKFTDFGAEFSANIRCDVQNNMNQYTAVHEFGHVLVGRTTTGGDSSYLIRIENPGTDGRIRDFSSTPELVMGRRTYNLARGLSFDWQRSDITIDNGWGSAALWDPNAVTIYQFPTAVYVAPGPETPTPTPVPTRYPVRAPQIGPCGPNSPQLPVPAGTPFPFQNNPCTFPNWETETTYPLAANDEVEEAAADMFLNWVYWKNYGGNTAFLDQRWRSSTCYPNGCNDAGLPGQVRSSWMNETMTILFDELN